MDTYSGILLTKCAQFRDEGQFVDVRLKVGKETFPAHCNVLASYSDYFYAMFAPTPCYRDLFTLIFASRLMSLVTKQPNKVGISIVFSGRSREQSTKTFWFPSKFLQTEIFALKQHKDGGSL